MNERPIPPSELDWYTDRSQCEEDRTDCGVRGNRPRREIPMEKYHSVF